MPLIAWAVAEFVFGLSAHDVLIVTVLAALPTAQNVFNYSQRFDVGEVISRDTVFLTTVGCVPVLIADHPPAGLTRQSRRSRASRSVPMTSRDDRSPCAAR